MTTVDSVVASIRAQYVQEHLIQAAALERYSKDAASYHQTKAERFLKELADAMGYALVKLDQSADATVSA